MIDWWGAAEYILRRRTPAKLLLPRYRGGCHDCIRDIGKDESPVLRPRPAIPQHQERDRRRLPRGDGERSLRDGPGAGSIREGTGAVLWNEACRGVELRHR